MKQIISAMTDDCSTRCICWLLENKETSQRLNRLFSLCDNALRKQYSKKKWKDKYDSLGKYIYDMKLQKGRVKF